MSGSRRGRFGSRAPRDVGLRKGRPKMKHTRDWARGTDTRPQVTHCGGHESRPSCHRVVGGSYCWNRFVGSCRCNTVTELNAERVPAWDRRLDSAASDSGRSWSHDHILPTIPPLDHPSGSFAGAACELSKFRRGENPRVRVGLLKSGVRRAAFCFMNESKQSARERLNLAPKDHLGDEEHHRSGEQLGGLECSRPDPEHLNPSHPQAQTENRKTWAELGPHEINRASRQEDIATLAYQLWQLRSSQDGSAEEDWHCALEALRERSRPE